MTKLIFASFTSIRDIRNKLKMSHKLTEGALARISAQQEEVQNAIVQVLGHKGIDRENGEKVFRLLLSDGKYSHSKCFLGLHHNERLHNKELQMFTILKLTKVILSRNKTVVMVLEFDVVAPGDEVGYKIGSPVPMASAGTAPGTAPNNTNPNAGVASNPNAGAALKRPAGPVDGQPPIKSTPASYQPKQRSSEEQDDIEKLLVVEASFWKKSKLRENQIQVEIADTEQLLKETQNTLDKQKQQLEEHKARSGAELAEMQKKRENLKSMMRKRADGNDSLCNLVPECPVCYERMNPSMQIFTCGNGHVICSVCKEKVEETGSKCINSCGAVYAGRATAMEQMIRQIFGNM